MSFWNRNKIIIMKGHEPRFQERKQIKLFDTGKLFSVFDFSLLFSATNQNETFASSLFAVSKGRRKKSDVSWKKVNYAALFQRLKSTSKKLLSLSREITTGEWRKIWKLSKFKQKNDTTLYGMKYKFQWDNNTVKRVFPSFLKITESYLKSERFNHWDFWDLRLETPQTNFFFHRRRRLSCVLKAKSN